MADIELEDAFSLASRLSTVDKVRLVERLMHTLETDLVVNAPLKSAYGLWADLNVSVSAEDIDEARREMWGNFPREDI